MILSPNKVTCQEKNSSGGSGLGEMKIEGYITAEEINRSKKKMNR
jgi:hypothetical protein